MGKCTWLAGSWWFRINLIISEPRNMSPALRINFSLVLSFWFIFIIHIFISHLTRNFDFFFAHIYIYVIYGMFKAPVSKWSLKGAVSYSEVGDPLPTPWVVAIFPALPLPFVLRASASNLNWLGRPKSKYCYFCVPISWLETHRLYSSSVLPVYPYNLWLILLLPST